MSDIYDIFILGGGINGAGIARDAAGRGLKICLADKGEIGGATSSWSTKLIHGGLSGGSLTRVSMEFTMLIKNKDIDRHIII